MSSTKKRENDSDAEEQEGTPKVSSSGSNKKAKTESSSSGEAVFSIGKKRKVTVSSFKGMLLVNIREFYEDRATGEEKPSNKGIALSIEQWNALKEQMADIDAAIKAKA